MEREDRAEDVSFQALDTTSCVVVSLTNVVSKSGAIMLTGGRVVTLDGFGVG